MRARNVIEYGLDAPSSSSSFGYLVSSQCVSRCTISMTVRHWKVIHTGNCTRFHSDSDEIRFIFLVFWKYFMREWNFEAEKCENSKFEIRILMLNQKPKYLWNENECTVPIEIPSNMARTYYMPQEYFQPTNLNFHWNLKLRHSYVNHNWLDIYRKKTFKRTFSTLNFGDGLSFGSTDECMHQMFSAVQMNSLRPLL